MSDIVPISASDTVIFTEKGYKFNRLLGEGSYAKVWLVNYDSTEEGASKECSLACKIIDSKRAPRDFVNKFLPREMDVLAKISHPHLIHLHSIYQRKTKFFIFMRFAERGDLLDHILANGEIKEKQARLWTRQLALGLQYLHTLEIVHRDIKCENVLITTNNNVKLADFGFSRFMIDTAGKRYLSSTYCGSLAYAAPELLRGKPYDPKHSDVWSLGIVLYVMLNQCMPFNDTDMNKLYELQTNNKWTFRSKISQIISEEVKSMVQSMLIPDALQRIIIDDVVNHRWFSLDERLKAMNPVEREALETGLRNKSGMIPKQARLSVPSWKKRKKEDQVVCVTATRFEQSSNVFPLETSVKPQQEVKAEARQQDKGTEMKKVDERSKTKSLDKSHSHSRDTLKPKITTSSVGLLDESLLPDKAYSKDHTSHHSTDKLGTAAQTKTSTSSYDQPKAGKRMTELSNKEKSSGEDLPPPPDIKAHESHSEEMSTDEAKPN